MKKNKIKPEQRLSEIKHMLYSSAPSISVAYPNTKSIEISIQFTDPDDKNQFTKNMTYKPDSKAYFQYDCPYRECINGGYDFKNLIEKAIQAPDRQAQEELACQGWQDRERINTHRCLLEALVTVKINL
ncbi:MAG: hypothetical protein V1747_10945 [Candidatus Omnitrophota bacterium]